MYKHILSRNNQRNRNIATFVRNSYGGGFAVCHVNKTVTSKIPALYGDTSRTISTKKGKRHVHERNYKTFGTESSRKRFSTR